MTLRYKQYGDTNAPLMLFLHGGGVSGWMWDKQVEYFSQYHCIVPDLPGHGASYDDSSFSIQHTAEQLIKLLEAVAQDKTIIAIGFSLGAQILAQIVSSKPQLIDYAMINSALVQPTPSLVKWIAPMVKLSYPLIKVRAFAKLQARALYVSEDYFEQYYRESCHMKRETLISVLEQNMSFQLPADFAKASGKLLITVGEREKAVMKSSAQALHKGNSQSQLIMFEGVGHGLSLYNPKLFNETVTRWINNEL